MVHVAVFLFAIVFVDFLSHLTFTTASFQDDLHQKLSFFVSSLLVKIRALRGTFLAPTLLYAVEKHFTLTSKITQLCLGYLLLLCSCTKTFKTFGDFEANT